MYILYICFVVYLAGVFVLIYNCTVTICCHTTVHCVSVQICSYLGVITECDSTLCCTCYHSVVCLSVCVCLSHLGALLKLSDGIRCHLAVTLM